MFRLAHISDPHLANVPVPTIRQLASKRITGYVNWKRNRVRALFGDTLANLEGDIKAANVDHIAVTGDLVNLSLDEEFAAARIWLETLGTHGDVGVVPGNHDAYVPGALAKARKHWDGYIQGDETPGKHAFPWLRRRGAVALIGVSSAIATAPFLATGKFGNSQGKRLAAMLDRARAERLFRVVLIHHPPVRDAAPSHKRLYGIGRFGKIMAAHGAELVLHGHTHLPQRHHLPGATGPVPVIGVPAASQAAGGHKPAAAWNLFEIDGESGAWSCTLTERGIAGATGQIAVRSRMVLHGGG